jgi:hypothetical protein
MARKIRITAGDVSVDAELNDSSTADLIRDALPIEGSGSKWGDEIYFAIPVQTGEADDAQAVVEMGDLGYWPTGKAFCIFYGPTPMSSGDEIRPASPVNVFGKIIGDPTVFKGAPAGRVTVEKVE